MKEVYKIGAIIINNKKLLVVKEKNMDAFISVGGKPERGETPEETLKRELKEELDVQLVSMEPFGKFSSEAIGNYDRITMDAYFVKINGFLKPSSEIENFCWIGSDYKQQNIKIAPLIEKIIMPKLIEKKMIE